MRALLFALACLFATLSSAQTIDRVAVVVNESMILQSQIDARIEQVQASGQVVNANARQQIIDSLIIEALQLEQARQRGISIDQRTLEQALTQIATQRGRSLEEMANQLGNDFATLRQQVEQELMIQQLRQKVISREVTVGEREIDEYLASQAGLAAANVRYRLAYARASSQAEADEIAQALKNGAEFADLVDEVRDLGWREVEALPSIFRNLVPGAQAGEVIEPVQRGDVWHLAQVVEVDDASTITEYQPRHLLISTQNRSSEAALAMISELQTRLENGATMASLAEYSEDAGSANNGGLLAWGTANTWVAEFSETVASLAVGERSQPFESRFGWHIVQLEDQRVVENSDATQRQQVRQTLGQAKTQRALEQWLIDLRSQAYIEVK